MFYKLLPIIVFIVVIIAFGFWVLSWPEKKTKKLLICPQSGMQEINPDGTTHCTECAKRYAGII